MSFAAKEKKKKKKVQQNQRQTNTSHPPTKTISKNDTVPLKIKTTNRDKFEENFILKYNLK